MTTKDLILINVENMGLIAGDSVRGKGLEIFSYAYTFDYIWRNSDSQKRKLAEKVLKNRDKQLFVKEYRIGNKSSNSIFFKDSLKKFDVKELAKNNFEDFEYICLGVIPKFLGYISVSEYDSSLESQKQLVFDLLKLSGKNLYSDEPYSYYDIDYMNFDLNNGDKKVWNGDYLHIHGGNLIEDTEDCSYVDGRIYGNNMVVEDWWNFGLEDVLSHFRELDPNNTIGVYTRKGKDWYVGYSLDVESFSIAYKEEGYQYGSDDYEEDDFEFLTFSENSELINKFVEILQGEVKTLKVSSEIFDALHIDNIERDFDYAPSMINLKIVDREYDENRIEAAYEIIDLVDWERNTDLASDAIERWIESNIHKEKLFSKYTHIKKLREISEENGKELVYSSVGIFTGKKQYAISFKGEEYHFSLAELFSSTPKELYNRASKAISKRLLEKNNHSLLMQKAKFVFVGLEDSYRSGNCESGTSQWVQTHGIDTSKIGAIRGDEILKIDFSNFTKRAVLEAIHRQQS